MLDGAKKKFDAADQKLSQVMEFLDAEKKAKRNAIEQLKASQLQRR